MTLESKNVNFNNQINDYKKTDIIINIVCDYYCLTKEEMIKKTRTTKIRQARQISHSLLLEYTKLSSVEIGKRVGGKDHATVLHSKKVVENLKQTDRVIREDIRQIKMMIDKEINIDNSVNFKNNKLMLINIVENAPKEDVLIERLLAAIGFDTERLSDAHKKEVSALKNEISILKSKDHPLIVELKKLPEEKQDFVLENRMKPYLLMNTKQAS